MRKPAKNAPVVATSKTATPEAPAPRRLSVWEWLDGFSLALLIVTMCSQLDVQHLGRDTLAEGLGYATKTLKLALSDVVFALTVLYFMARTAQMQAWKRLWWPPLPCWALIFALLVSFTHSSSIWAAVAGAGKPITKESKEAIAEIVQWTGYFLIAPWVFVNLILDRRGTATAGDGAEAEPIVRRELAVRSLFFATVASAVVSLVQWQQFESAVPRGLFSSPNVYAAFLAVAVPFLVEAETPNERQQSRFWFLGITLLVVTLLTVVSHWTLIALIIGLLVAIMVRQGQKGARMFRIALVTVLALAAWTFYRKPGKLAEARTEFARVSSAGQQVKKQYIEWQIASRWNAPRERAFATGVGPGNYQLNIGTLYQYDGVPNEEKMPPDSNNFWLVQAMSIGVLGLGALVWTITHFLGMAWRAARAHEEDWLGAAVTGALCAWVFVNCFHALIVRGAGLVLALLFAFAVVAAAKKSNETPTGKVLDTRKS